MVQTYQMLIVTAYVSLSILIIIILTNSCYTPETYSKNPKIAYLSIVDEGTTFRVYGRKQYTTSDLIDVENIFCISISKKDFTKINNVEIFVNKIPSASIQTSISHNFMVSKFGNTYVANAGRDKCYDISYKDGHDKGMYIFRGNSGGNFDYEQHIIQKETGAHQTHPASNECFSNIIQARNKYYIFCRYNFKEGVRKIQVFVSDDLNKWRLKNVLELYRNGILLKEYSIYHMTVIYHNNKFYGLIRFSSKTYKQTTNDTAYGLYSVYSTDGYKFHMHPTKILNSEYWPAAGEILVGNKVCMIAYKSRYAKLLELKNNIFVDSGLNFQIQS